MNALLFYSFYVCFYVQNDLSQHHPADTALHIINTWWQCAPNILSAFVLGITKTHNLRFQESEALQAVFASHLCPNVLKAPARLAAHYKLDFLQVHISMIQQDQFS